MLVRVVVEISEYQYFKTFLTCLYYIPIVDSSNYSRCSHECSLLLSAFLAPLVCGGKWELCAVQALGMAGENRQRIRPPERFQRELRRADWRKSVLPLSVPRFSDILCVQA